MDVYSEAVRILAPNHIDHHRSDLFILMNWQSMPIIRQYRAQGGIVEEILEEGTQLYWYFIPWGYTPYWHRRFRASVENCAWHFIYRNDKTGTLSDWSDANLKKSFSDMRIPPQANFYPAIRVALGAILQTYRIKAIDQNAS